MDYPRRGNIYWTTLPDEQPRKRRPVLVLSPDVRNRLAVDIIVAPLSTSRRPAPTHVSLGAKEGGLTQRSVVKCEQITTLLKSRIAGPALGGQLSAARLHEVERAVLRAIGVPID